MEVGSRLVTAFLVKMKRQDVNMLMLRLLDGSTTEIDDGNVLE